MDKFEYKKTESGFHWTDTSEVLHLQGMGDVGWELVSVVTDGFGGSMKKYYWKRKFIS